MKKLNLNNGNPANDLTTPQDLQDNAAEILRLWPSIAQMMDDDTREQVHAELAPCTEIEFLVRYLEIAPDNLIVG